MGVITIKPAFGIIFCSILRTSDKHVQVFEGFFLRHNTSGTTQKVYQHGPQIAWKGIRERYQLEVRTKNPYN